MNVQLARIVDFRVMAEGLTDSFPGEYDIDGIAIVFEELVAAELPQGWELQAGTLSVPDAEDIDEVRSIMSDVIGIAIPDRVCEQVLFVHLI